MDVDNEVRSRIRNFIIENMDAFYDERELQDNDNIFEKGFVSSSFAMRLLNFIESQFSIEVSDEDIVLENFSSVENMTRLVQRLKGGHSYAK